MSIDRKTAERIAKLARIRITGEEEKFAGEINGILQWIDQLQEVNTDGVEPMVSVTPMELPRRDDRVTDGHRRDEILANAPRSEHGCFVVPKVIGES